MARALYCDRCGKLFREGQSAKATMKFEKYNDEFNGDMCSSCLDELECAFYTKEEKKVKKEGKK